MLTIVNEQTNKPKTSLIIPSFLETTGLYVLSVYDEKRFVKDFKCLTYGYFSNSQVFLSWLEMFFFKNKQSLLSIDSKKMVLKRLWVDQTILQITNSSQ